MTINDFDLSVIYNREDGSYVLKLLHDDGLYHCPNEGDWVSLWSEVDAYVAKHPSVLQPEPKPEQHEETPEEIIDRYSQAVQNALDAFVQTRRYDGIMSACSYADSTDPVFAAEAAYCIRLRDETWRQAYTIMGAVVDGTRSLMSIEELIAELPIGSAEWPEIEA